MSEQIKAKQQKCSNWPQFPVSSFSQEEKGVFEKRDHTTYMQREMGGKERFI
jgi:hypothetical protein